MKLILLLSVLCFSLSFQAASNIYDLNLKLSLGGKQVSTKNIQVTEGKVNVINDNTFGNNTYIEVLAKEGEVKTNKGILLRFKIGHINEDKSKTIVSRPIVLAKSGKEASILVSEDGEDSVALKVVATRYRR